MPNPAPTLSVLGAAANGIYTSTAVGGLQVPAGLTLLMQSTPNQLSSGFSAAAFRDANGNIIIAYEGTTTDGSTFGNGTLGADAIIAQGQTPDSLTFAAKFATDVLNTYGADGSPIYVTGHSLGGTEAEAGAQALVALGANCAGGATFGATGLPNFSGTGLPSLINYINQGDFVGNFATDPLSAFSSLAASQGYVLNHFGSVVQTGSSDGAAGLDATISSLTALSNSDPETAAGNLTAAFINTASILSLHFRDAYSNFLDLPSLSPSANPSFNAIIPLSPGLFGQIASVNGIGISVADLPAGTSSIQFVGGGAQISTTPSTNQAPGSITLYSQDGSPFLTLEKGSFSNLNYGNGIVSVNSLNSSGENIGTINFSPSTNSGSFSSVTGGVLNFSNVDVPNISTFGPGTSIDLGLDRSITYTASGSSSIYIPGVTILSIPSGADISSSNGEIVATASASAFFAGATGWTSVQTVDADGNTSAVCKNTSGTTIGSLIISDSVDPATGLLSFNDLNINPLGQYSVTLTGQGVQADAGNAAISVAAGATATIATTATAAAPNQVTIASNATVTDNTGTDTDTVTGTGVHLLTVGGPSSTANPFALDQPTVNFLSGSSGTLTAGGSTQVEVADVQMTQAWAGSILTYGTTPGGAWSLTDTSSTPGGAAGGSALTVTSDINQDGSGTLTTTTDSKAGATSTTAQAFATAAQEYGEVGSAFGSSLGRILAGNNAFAQISTSTVLGALGEQVAAAIGVAGAGADAEQTINTFINGDETPVADHASCRANFIAVEERVDRLLYIGAGSRDTNRHSDLLA